MSADLSPAIEGPRTYQSAWQWNDDDTAKLMTAEDWLREEADVDAALDEPTMDVEREDDGPDRGGILRAIAEEVATLRRERSQWAEQCTQQSADLIRLRAENERLRGVLAIDETRYGVAMTGPGTFVQRQAEIFDALISRLAARDDYRDMRDRDEALDGAFHSAIHALRRLGEFARIVSPTWKAAAEPASRSVAGTPLIESSTVHESQTGRTLSEEDVAAMRVRVAEIRERLNASTPGAWESGDGKRRSLWNGSEVILLTSGTERRVLLSFNHNFPFRADSALVANAPADLAALCNFVDRLSSVATGEEPTSELKPCPFCGGEARTEEDGGQFRVECRECGCDQYGEFEPDAIAAWNRRTPSDPVERREGDTNG